MARKKIVSIYLCGMTIDMSCFDVKVISDFINDRYSMWLGNGAVDFCITDAGNHDYTLTFKRNWGIDYQTMQKDSLFAGDKQMWFGMTWQNNGVFTGDLPGLLRENRMLFFDDFPSIAKEYKRISKENGASVPREVILAKADSESFIINIKYGRKQ